MTTETLDAKLRNILLIPTDFSEVCNLAVSHGVRLAKHLGYRVCILHIINKETRSLLKKRKVGDEYIDVRLKEIRRYYSRKYDIDIETRAQEGSIFSTIEEIAIDIKANLMVLGTHGKKGLQLVFGSYAMKVAEQSSIPVIITQKRSFNEGYRQIIFPVSNDIEPRPAVRWVTLMARLFHAHVHIFQSPEKDRGLDARLKTIIREITGVLEAEKVDFSLITAEKTRNFADEVISCSVMMHADLIMIMTRPNVDIPGFSMAAWGEKLIFNNAQIPVMCINPSDTGHHYYEWSMLT